jgi:hypothetical protein
VASTIPLRALPLEPADRALSRAWITDELLAETRRVWSNAYQRVITESEGVEILSNVKRLAEVLGEASRKELAA